MAHHHKFVSFLVFFSLLLVFFCFLFVFFVFVFPCIYSFLPELMKVDVLCVLSVPQNHGIGVQG